VRAAKRANAPSIAYTYSEAITYYEYMYDTSKLAREAGLKNVLVSNGYINKKPLLELCKYLDGANINLKSYDNRIYLALNGGTLWPVLNAFKTFHQEGVWFEMTTLVVPTYVDDPDMIKRMCGWILEELGPDYPLHKDAGRIQELGSEGRNSLCLSGQRARTRRMPYLLP
jgi:pyruvate formate lyase activating enzyme